MSDSSAGEALFRQAATARDNHEYARAEDLQQQGLALWRQQDERFARELELENLAGIHFIQQKFELAASEYERVLELRERLVPDDGPPFCASSIGLRNPISKTSNTIPRRPLCDARSP